MSEITPASRVEAVPDVLVQELPDGELILLSLATEDYFGLDGIGGHMWRELSEGLSIAAVASRLSETYDASAEVLERDLIELVEQLASSGLISVLDA